MCLVGDGDGGGGVDHAGAFATERFPANIRNSDFLNETMRTQSLRQQKTSMRRHADGGLNYGRHAFVFLVIGLCCSISGCVAGYACLSNPCVFGVCIDDLNR